MIHSLGLRSGFETIHQNHKHPLTTASLNQFLRFARDHLADPTLIKTSRDVSLIARLDNYYLNGIKKFQKIFQEEDWNCAPSRFGWGVNFGPPVGGEGDQNQDWIDVQTK